MATLPGSPESSALRASAPLEQWSQVCIVGLGLIGGSLGMALRDRKLARRVIGIVRRPATIGEALSVGAIDEGTLEFGAASAADVLTIPPLVEALSPYLRPGVLVTDVGSTKAALMRDLDAALPAHAELVGGHPMAGSERGGVLAARADTTV